MDLFETDKGVLLTVRCSPEEYDDFEGRTETVYKNLCIFDYVEEGDIN